MDTMNSNISLRTLLVIALLALVPVVAFLAGRVEPVVALSFVSVLIIVTSLYWMFGPSRSETTGTH